MNYAILLLSFSLAYLVGVRSHKKLRGNRMSLEGERLADVVHNTLMFVSPQKLVVRTPFRSVSTPL